MEYINSRTEILTSEKQGVGIAAMYVLPPRDSVHVGIFCKTSDYEEVVHFTETNKVRIEDIREAKFEIYNYSWLNNFPEEFIDSLMAVVDYIAENKDNTLILDLKSIVYNGGTFEITTGKYITGTTPECLVNCGVFAMALLETFHYHLLDWESWPTVTIENRSQYLENWLNHFGAPPELREQYYHFNKEIRGRHIMASSQYGNSKV